MTFFINGAVFHGHQNDYSSTIEERVELLYSNPYRFYISPFIWTMRGSSRTDELYVLFDKAYNQKKFKLCRRIIEAIEVLNMTYGINPVRVNIKKFPFVYQIRYNLEKLFIFTLINKIMK